jgi:hypothetical protein
MRIRRGLVAAWSLLSAAAIAGACSGGVGDASSGDDEGVGVSGHGGTGSTTTTTASGDDDGGLVSTDGGGSQPDASPPQKTCDPSCAAAGGACLAGVCTIVENPGGLDPASQKALDAGGAADPALRWLYPYDGTVFARGLLAPKLQLDAPGATALLVHATAPNLDYKGYFAVGPKPSATIAQAAWVAITMAVGVKDGLKVDVTRLAGGAAAGPATETWRMAQGSLRGTIYYETYDSELAGGKGSVGIMKIAPGASSPTPFRSGCGNVCHTASADGSTLVAATQLGESAAYDLKNGGAKIKSLGSDAFTYGGLYPDGSVLMSATHYRTWGGEASHLYDVKTGNKVNAPGWDGVVKHAGTVAFSPDGKRIAFNHEDTGGGRTLAVMSYDAPTHAFSGLEDVASDKARVLGWPAFTPDGARVVYHAGSSSKFETDANASGDLYVTDVASHQVTRLDALDGYAGGQTYLPANDPALNFAPTVLPEAVGGYFWVVFTSHRSYGNTLPSKDAKDVNGKLWVAAIDLVPEPGVDPSHPAFYLDGQEPSADNLRGFWVLDPCKADGADCQFGDECCGGFCRGGDAGPRQCQPPPVGGGCSAELDKCTTAADCCDKSDLCINSRCSQPAPPK